MYRILDSFEYKNTQSTTNFNSTQVNKTSFELHLICRLASWHSLSFSTPFQHVVHRILLCAYVRVYKSHQVTKSPNHRRHDRSIDYVSITCAEKVAINNCSQGSKESCLGLQGSR
jgi:hypothetical protein